MRVGEAAVLSFLWRNSQKVLSQADYDQKPSPVPTDRNNTKRFARIIAGSSLIKRIPLHSSLNGTMTVEASVVIPLFLFFFMNLLSAAEMIRLHGKIQAALWNCGRQATVCRALTKQEETENSEETADGLIKIAGMEWISDAVLEESVKKDLGKTYMWESPLAAGEKELQFSQSVYGEDYVDIKVTYAVETPFKIPGIKDFRMSNRYFARVWNGYDVSEREEGEPEVYVTDYGEVYHLRRDCSHIERIVMSVNRNRVRESLNKNGERYLPCAVCGGERKDTVFLTAEGTRYHSSEECSALMRYVISMKLKEAQKRYRPCSRCA